MKYICFAVDLGCTRELLELQRWWDNIVSFGPKLGYNPNAAKSWLVIKPIVQKKA